MVIFKSKTGKEHYLDDKVLERYPYLRGILKQKTSNCFMINYYSDDIIEEVVTMLRAGYYRSYDLPEAERLYRLLVPAEVISIGNDIYQAILSTIPEALSAKLVNLDKLTRRLLLGLAENLRKATPDKTEDYDYDTEVILSENGLLRWYSFSNNEFPDLREPYWTYWLEFACKNGYLEMARLAVSRGVQLHLKPFMLLAVKSGNLDLVKFLQKQGLKIGRDEMVAAYDGDDTLMIEYFFPFLSTKSTKIPQAIFEFILSTIPKEKIMREAAFLSACKGNDPELVRERWSKYQKSVPFANFSSSVYKYYQMMFLEAISNAASEANDDVLNEVEAIFDLWIYSLSESRQENMIKRKDAAILKAACKAGRLNLATKYSDLAELGTGFVEACIEARMNIIDWFVSGFDVRHGQDRNTFVDGVIGACKAGKEEAYDFLMNSNYARNSHVYVELAERFTAISKSGNLGFLRRFVESEGNDISADLTWYNGFVATDSRHVRNWMLTMEKGKIMEIALSSRKLGLSTRDPQNDLLIRVLIKQGDWPMLRLLMTEYSSKRVGLNLDDYNSIIGYADVVAVDFIVEKFRRMGGTV